ncbi:MAG: MarR family transcriptional regulator, partial [Acidimicrobiales bacterium]
MTATVPPGRTANLLGALSLAVSDRMATVVAGTSEHSETAASAISALAQFLHGPSVDRLSQVVGLSQSGGVRLVDRLQRDGLVERRPGGDRRTAAVSLTARGRRAAR